MAYFFEDSRIEKHQKKELFFDIQGKIDTFVAL